MNQSGRLPSELLGIVDPVAGRRVDLAAMVEWRRLEQARERERREWRALELEAQALVIVSAMNDKVVDVRALLGVAPVESEGVDFRDFPTSEEAMRESVANYRPTPGERAWLEGEGAGVEIIAAG